eukprot:986692-Amorphochlora_amoeboformis.AAC.1
MGCITSRGGLSVCAQPRKYQPYQNEKFTEKQKLLILNLFNLIDQDGGGLADVGKLYLDFKKKSESSGGLLDDFVEILVRYLRIVTVSHMHRAANENISATMKA